MIYEKPQICSEDMWGLWVATIMGGSGKHTEGAYSLDGELVSFLVCLWKNSNYLYENRDFFLYLLFHDLDELDLQLDAKWGKLLALHNRTKFLKVLVVMRSDWSEIAPDPSILLRE